jgi:hypothetical protein
VVPLTLWKPRLLDVSKVPEQFLFPTNIDWLMSVNAQEKMHLQPQCHTLANSSQMHGLKVLRPSPRRSRVVLCQ